MSPAITLPADGLRDQAIELRAVSVDEDLAAFVEAFQDPAIAQGAYQGQLAATEAALRSYLDRAPARMEEGDAVLLSVWEPAAERLSGQTMLFRCNWDDLTAELGFWIAPWARGRGLGTPALALTLALAFDHLGIERVYGITNVDNVGAQRAMESAGLRPEGIFRGAEKTRTGRADAVQFAMLVNDPRQALA